tara:strand:- start:300 stop:608 length:309 start_codon:yes stop_codon:yes gene_type:complete
MMIDLKKFKEIPHGSIFSQGVFIDSDEDGYIDGLPTIHAQDTKGKKMSWVATKGQIDDWAVYYHFFTEDTDYVKDSGLKLYNENNIKKLVPCTDEVFELYRF